MSSTEEKIKKALLRIEKGRPKIITSDRRLSIAAVAEEAGIHRTTIINRYPLIADTIRSKSGIKSNNKSDNKERLLELETLISEANKEITQLKSQLARAISIQATELIDKG